jgi:hypothetical protein
MPTTGGSLFSRHDRPELFRWLKAVERGVAIFLERSLAGTPVGDRELRSVREIILAAYPGGRQRPALHMRLLGKPVLDRLQREWAREPQRGPGLLTRMMTSTTVWTQTRDFRLGWQAYKTGDILPALEPAAAPSRSVDVVADQLVAHARTTTNKYPKEALPVRCAR